MLAARALKRAKRKSTEEPEARPIKAARKPRRQKESKTINQKPDKDWDIFVRGEEILDSSVLGRLESMANRRMKPGDRVAPQLDGLI